MTVTRKYYEALIGTFEKIASCKANDPTSFLEYKQELFSLINRITQFNLIPITFTQSTIELLAKSTIDDFEKEKLTIVNETHYELNECLHTTRLRYGGELLYYIYKIKIGLLNLPILELKEFQRILKQPEHYYFPESWDFDSEEEQIKKQKELQQLLKKESARKKKRKVNLTKPNIVRVEDQLTQFIADYKSYIFEHYPSIASEFSFYSKKVRAYFTEAMSDDIFEFRIHSYKTEKEKSSLAVIPDYYDFYPSYFSNLEEKTDKQVNAIVLSLSKKDFNLKNPFTEENIHRELVGLFIRNVNEKQVQELVKFLYKCQGFSFAQENGSNKQFDLYCENSREKIVFEIFHTQKSNLEHLSKRIEELKSIPKGIKKHFVFTAFPGDSVKTLLSKNGIILETLFHLTDQQFYLKNSVILHWYIKNKLPEIEITKGSTSIEFEGNQLIKRLNNCEKGKLSWPEYESIGMDIFKFLFSSDFHLYMAEEQTENDLKNHRRDLLVNNNFKDPSSFWSQMKSDFNARALIVEFKNYTKKLNSTTLFSTTKYAKKGVGNFAIVFSRKGLDPTAIKEQKELYDNDKLLIEFNDDELIEMIREKIFGKSPLERLESKKFEIIKKK
ncbi:hypothetical protein [uncultured Fluviicola sp.]|uniref:hypothetical protein n=1 Tax=uncultured Fluviicola sp. TaxID=463303 RepID=UPI0025E8FAE0|nr:hypothetical protein [uncultured Fluviicola sp.]